MNKCRRFFLLSFIILKSCIFSFSQPFSNGINTTNPSTKAALDIHATAAFPQGLLIPRMPSTAITPLSVGLGNAEKGLMFFDTTNNVFQFWNGTIWQALGSGGSGLWATNTTNIYNTNTANVGIGTNKPSTKLYVAGSRITVDGYFATGNTSSGFNLMTLGDGFSSSGATTKKWEIMALNDAYSSVPDQNGLNFTFWTGNSGNTRIRFQPNGNVGIGTVYPANKLDVEGSVAIGATYSGTSAAPANGLIVEGSIGIGTISPVSKLSVGAANQFQVDGSGDIVAIKGLAYEWPVAQAAGSLVNDGTGILTWAPAAGLSGTGTLNTLPIWTGAGSLGLSAIRQTGAGVTASLSVGNITPNALSGKFYVMGDGSGPSIRGESSATGTANTGILGLASNASAEAVGVQGTATGTSDAKGVAATANSTGTNAYGLYASSTGAATNSYALYATVSGGSNRYAGVFMGGNVGINVTTPMYSLHMAENSANPGIFVRQDGSGPAVQGNNYNNGAGVLGGSSGSGPGVQARNTGTGPALYAEISGPGTGPSGIFMGGNVGIGTLAPTALLSVKRGSNTNSAAQPTGIFASVIYNATNAIGENGLLVKNNWNATTSTVFEVGNDFVGGAYASFFKVDGLGRVTMPLLGTGIVTANAGVLSVTTGTPVVGAGAASRVPFWTAANTLSSNAAFAFDNASSTLGIGVAPSNLGRLQVDNILLSGREIKFLFGGTAHWSIINATAGLQIGTTSSQGFATGAFDGTPAMTVTTAGNVGLGCATPAAKLHVIGTIIATGLVTPNGTTCSDIRYKDHVAGIKSPVGILQKIDGKTYTWKQREFPQWHFPDGMQYGFIAQEIEKVLPSIVLTDNSVFQYKSVDYSRLTPILVEAVKEQQGMIDSLKTANEILNMQFQQIKVSLKENLSQLNEIKEYKTEMQLLRQELEALKRLSIGEAKK